jgi:hypothetical protein
LGIAQKCASLADPFTDLLVDASGVARSLEPEIIHAVPSDPSASRTFGIGRTEPSFTISQGMPIFPSVNVCS